MDATGLKYGTRWPGGVTPAGPFAILGVRRQPESEWTLSPSQKLAADSSSPRARSGTCRHAGTTPNLPPNGDIFLIAFKGVYTVLKEGAKTSPQSRQWFGAKDRQRRSDPLLQYLYQARDDDEHGLNPVTTRVPDRLSIGGRGPDHTLQFDVSGPVGLGWRLEATDGDGKPVPFEYTPAQALLARVHGRDKNNRYDPPAEHLGAKLAGNLPAAVGELAVAYLEAIVLEAERTLVSHRAVNALQHVAAVVVVMV